MGRIVGIVVLVLAALAAAAGWLRERELRAAEAGAARARFARDSVQIIGLTEQLAVARFATDAAETRAMAAETETATARSGWSRARLTGDSLRNRLAAFLAPGAPAPTSGEAGGAIVALDSILARGDSLERACARCEAASADMRAKHEVERRAADSTIAALRRQVAEVPALAGPACMAVSSPGRWQRWSDRLTGGAVGGILGYLAGKAGGS